MIIRIMNPTPIFQFRLDSSECQIGQIGEKPKSLLSQFDIVIHLISFGFDLGWTTNEVSNITRRAK